MNKKNEVNLVVDTSGRENLFSYDYSENKISFNQSDPSLLDRDNNGIVIKDPFDDNIITKEIIKKDDLIWNPKRYKNTHLLNNYLTINLIVRFTEKIGETHKFIFLAGKFSFPCLKELKKLTVFKYDENTGHLEKEVVGKERLLSHKNRPATKIFPLYLEKENDLFAKTILRYQEVVTNYLPGEIERLEKELCNNFVIALLFPEAKEKIKETKCLR